MRVRTQTDEVLFADEEIRVFGSDMIRELACRATKNSSGKARVCLHRSPDATLHEMLVALRRDVEYPPHRNRRSEEIHFVLFGEARLLLYNEAGELVECLELKGDGSGTGNYSRIPVGMYHCLRVESDVCVFLETKLGPFSPVDNETAPFIA